MDIRRSLLPALAVCFVFSPGRAQDWPQWWGPNRDGHLPSLDEVKQPEKLSKKWQITIGTGHSSPLVVGGRVYLHSRPGEDEVASGVDLGSGKILWQDRYPAPYTMNRAATGHGRGPKSTPVFGGDRLYTFGISGIASYYDVAAGRRIWQKEHAARFPKTSPLYGTAMSPMVDRGLVIFHAGGDGGGALLAVDASTGEQRWIWDRGWPRICLCRNRRVVRRAASGDADAGPERRRR